MVAVIRDDKRWIYSTLRNKWELIAIVKNQNGKCEIYDKNGRLRASNKCL